MRKIVLLVLFLAISILTFSQDNECTEYDEWNQGLTFRVDAGAFIPIDNLKNTLSVSPHLGLFFGFQLTEKYRFDLGTSLFIPINRNKLEFFLPDTTLTGKAILSGTMGLWFTRTERLKKCWLLDNRFGTGLGFFQTDIPTNKPKEENDSVHSSETVFICLGTSIRKIVFTRRSIGLALNYFFVPYNAFEENLKSDFGCQYLTLSTCYTF
jgi:hypothetical protein